MPRFNSFSRGLGLGIGIAIVVPVAIATLAPVLKPVVRQGLKSGIRAIEKGRDLFAESMEAVEDLVAETQSELREEHLQRHNRADPDEDADITTASGEAEAEADAADGDLSDARSNVKSIVNE